VPQLCTKGLFACPGDFEAFYREVHRFSIQELACRGPIVEGLFDLRLLPNPCKLGIGNPVHWIRVEARDRALEFILISEQAHASSCVEGMERCCQVSARVLRNHHGDCEREKTSHPHDFKLLNCRTRLWLPNDDT
jgi:hypothetical protein